MDSMLTQKTKWAMGGFVVGFLVCYLLLGTARHWNARAPSIANAAPNTAWPLSATAPGFNPLIPPTPEVTTQTPPHWLHPTQEFIIQMPPRGLSLTPEPPGPGYSTDLIDDTHPQ